MNLRRTGKSGRRMAAQTLDFPNPSWLGAGSGHTDCTSDRSDFIGMIGRMSFSII